MAIKNWHWGKIIICWAMGVFLTFVGVPLWSQPEPQNAGGIEFILWILLILALVPGSLITVLVVTWKWLSGKEKQEPPPMP